MKRGMPVKCNRNAGEGKGKDEGGKKETAGIDRMDGINTKSG
jgi:hypothetical protein